MDRRQFLATLAAPTLAASALISGTARAQDRSRMDTLRVVPETLTDIFDPHFTTSFLTRDIAYLVYDTLFAVNDRFEPRPQMVERWDTSPDGRDWTFTLREGLAFHDGTPVTPEDCTASLRRWGARDALGGLMLRATESLDPIDGRSFRLRLASPFGLVLQALSKPGAMVPMIMPRRLAETSPTRPVTDIVGSGAYRFRPDEYRAGDRVVFTRNDAYRPRAEPGNWASGAKVATFARVEFLSMPDPSAQVAALRTGEVDYLERLPADVVPALERNRDVTVKVASSYGYQGILRFNHTRPPFDDVRVRRAVMTAVDQADHLAAVSGLPEYSRPCLSMYGCGTPYETTAGMPARTDLEAARRMLREAGTDLSRPVVILHPATSPGIAALGLVTEGLLRQLGFQVDLQSMDFSTFLGRRARPDGWNIFHTTNTVPDMATPVQNVFMEGAGPPNGFPGWPRDAEVDRERAAFAAASGEPERARLAESIHRRAAEDGFYMPLGQFVGPSAWRSNLTGVPTGPAMFLWNIRRT